MKWEQIEGHWTEFRGTVQKQWGKLTNDDLDVIHGDRTQMVGRLQERYGMKQEQAERAIDDWLAPLQGMA